MMSNVHCEEFVGRLADLLERDVDEATRAALESHALSCGDCGPLLADLRKLRIDASSLPVLEPRRDLWEGIAQRIDAPVIPLRAVNRTRLAARWPRWASMAAAAVLLIAVTSTVTYVLTTHLGSLPSTTTATSESSRHSDSVLSPSHNAEPRGTETIAVAPETSRTVPPSGPAPIVRNVRNNKPSAERVYSDEIARLRLIVDRRRSQLDPVTISVIERNLKVIDDAIAQCRLALAKDPASRFLIESLNNALQTKVELLRTATMLPARS